MVYDVLIIGGGPAGLCTASPGARRQTAPQANTEMLRPWPSLVPPLATGVSLPATR